MKNIISKSAVIIFLIITLFSINLNSQGWVVHPPISKVNLNSVVFLNDDSIIMVGEEGTLFYTLDGGSSWQNHDNLPTNVNLNSVFFIDEHKGFIVGESGTILRTVDGGNIWTDISVEDYYNLIDVEFINYENGIAVGKKEVHIDGNTYYLAAILTTTNGGENWVDHSFDESGLFNSVSFITENIAIAVGNNGRVARSADGGETWMSQTPDVNYNLHDIKLYENYPAIIVGESGTVLISYNAGETWDNYSIDYYYNLKEVTSIRLDETIAVGEKEVRIGGDTFYMATILKSADGGFTWNEELSDERGSYNGLSYYSEDKSLVVGDDGAYVCLGTTTDIEFEVSGPLTFTLEQNYPNPFNPSTNIKYSVPENGFVKLSVYNLVGKEVKVLVNGQVNAGFYEIGFDATTLPSGIYFYRIQAGSFVETKKMVLLK